MFYSLNILEISLNYCNILTSTKQNVKYAPTDPWSNQSSKFPKTQVIQSSYFVFTLEIRRCRVTAGRVSSATDSLAKLEDQLHHGELQRPLKACFEEHLLINKTAHRMSTLSPEICHQSEGLHPNCKLHSHFFFPPLLKSSVPPPNASHLRSRMTGIMPTMAHGICT